MSDDPAFGQFRKAHVLVLPVNKWDKVCKPCDKKGRSRSVTKTRVQIPLGPPPFLPIRSVVYNFLERCILLDISSIGQSIGQKRGMEAVHGFTQLLMPPMATV